MLFNAVRQQKYLLVTILVLLTLNSIHAVEVSSTYSVQGTDIALIPMSDVFERPSNDRAGAIVYLTDLWLRDFNGNFILDANGNGIYSAIVGESIEIEWYFTDASGNDNLIARAAIVYQGGPGSCWLYNNQTQFCHETN